jgi:membrane protein
MGNTRRERAVTLARAVVHEMRVERVTFLAGSVAYHAFVSLLPLLLLVLAVVSAIGNTTLEQAFLDLARAVATRGAADALVAELRRASASSGVSILGAVVLVWGTLRMFRGLDTAFSAIYETETNNGLADQLTDGAVVFLAFGLALLAAAGLKAAVPWGGGTLSWGLQRVTLVLGLTVVLFPMYYVFPDTDVGVLEVLPGTLVAATGLAGAEGLFGLYVASTSQAPEQSVVGAILVFLTWLYLSGLVVLVGAVVNAVLSNRSADVSVDPVLGGVPRNEHADVSDRATLLADVEALESRLAEADGVVVTVDGAATELPPPGGVRVVDRSMVLGEGPVVMELRWSTR